MRKLHAIKVVLTYLKLLVVEPGVVSLVGAVGVVEVKVSMPSALVRFALVTLVPRVRTPAALGRFALGRRKRL